MSDKSIEWHMKSKELSGEMYDLTASSTISATGKIKFKEAKKNGISETFDKYIYELNYMTDDQTDDKFYKRMDRLNFLQDCQDIDKMIMEEPNISNELNQPYLQKLFSFTCNYLNGGDGINQHTKQPIIVILSGGNVTTIYINLLKNVLSNEDEIKKLISKYFDGIGGESIEKIENILTKIRELFNEKNLYIKIKEPIQRLNVELNNTKLKLSDLDFIIVPNKFDNIRSLFPSTKSKGGGMPTDMDMDETRPSSRPTRKRRAPDRYEPVDEVKKRKQTAKFRVKDTTPAPVPKSRTQKTISTVQDNTENAVQTDVNTEGVLLVRLKTANKYLDLQNSTKEMPEKIKQILGNVNEYYTTNEKACYDDLDKLKTTIQLLRQPQLFRHDYLENPDVAVLCKNYLLKMKAQKKLISEMTDLNLKHLIDYLSNPERDDNADLTPDAQTYVEKDDSIKLANFMKFIHINGIRQNELIANLCRDEDTKYRTAGHVVDNFKSLETITNRNNPLVKIMSELVLEFSNNNAIKNTLKRIHNTFTGSENNKGTFANITPAVFNLSPLHTRLTYSIGSLINPEKSKIENMIIPNNSKISTNIFTPVKITSDSGYEMSDDELNELLKGALDTHNAYADMLEPDLDDLIKRFETLKLSPSGGRKKTHKRRTRTRTRTRTRRRTRTTKYKARRSKKH